MPDQLDQMLVDNTGTSADSLMQKFADKFSLQRPRVFDQFDPTFQHLLG